MTIIVSIFMLCSLYLERIGIIASASYQFIITQLACLAIISFALSVQVQEKVASWFSCWSSLTSILNHVYNNDLKVKFMVTASSSVKYLVPLKSYHYSEVYFLTLWAHLHICTYIYLGVIHKALFKLNKCNKTLAIIAEFFYHNQQYHFNICRCTCMPLCLI